MSARLMNEEEQRQWERARSRGRFSYVVFVGIALYGSVFAAIVLVARLTVLRSPIVKWESVGTELIQFVMEAILFGLWMGLWTWHLNEKRFLSEGEGSHRC